jgi:hypothetical protein
VSPGRIVLPGLEVRLFATEAVVDEDLSSDPIYAPEAAHDEDFSRVLNCEGRASNEALAVPNIDADLLAVGGATSCRRLERGSLSTFLAAAPSLVVLSTAVPATAGVPSHERTPAQISAPVAKRVTFSINASDTEDKYGFVGQAVFKEFLEHGEIKGTIESFDEADDLCMAKYEDGNEEELDFEHVNDMLQSSDRESNNAESKHDFVRRTGFSAAFSVSERRDRGRPKKQGKLNLADEDLPAPTTPLPMPSPAPTRFPAPAPAPAQASSIAVAAAGMVSRSGIRLPRTAWCPSAGTLVWVSEWGREYVYEVEHMPANPSTPVQLKDPTGKNAPAAARRTALRAVFE